MAVVEPLPVILIVAAFAPVPVEEIEPPPDTTTPWLPLVPLPPVPVTEIAPLTELILVLAP